MVQSFSSHALTMVGKSMKMQGVVANALVAMAKVPNGVTPTKGARGSSFETRLITRSEGIFAMAIHCFYPRKFQDQISRITLDYYYFAWFTIHLAGRHPFHLQTHSIAKLWKP